MIMLGRYAGDVALNVLKKKKKTIKENNVDREEIDTEEFWTLQNSFVSISSPATLFFFVFFFKTFDGTSSENRPNMVVKFSA